MSYSVLDELERARSELALSPADLAPLPAAEARAVVGQVLEAFVREPSARWWWDHLTKPALGASFHDGRAFARLMRILPVGQEKAWFIVEPDELPFAVYSASARAIEQVLGECPAFEYYVVGPGMDWLVCENHHGVLKAVGAGAESRLRTVLETEADQVEWSGRS